MVCWPAGVYPRATLGLQRGWLWGAACRHGCRPRSVAARRPGARPRCNRASLVCWKSSLGEMRLVLLYGFGCSARSERSWCILLSSFQPGILLSLWLCRVLVDDGSFGPIFFENGGIRLRTGLHCLTVIAFGCEFETTLSPANGIHSSNKSRAEVPRVTRKGSSKHRRDLPTANAGPKPSRQARNKISVVEAVSISASSVARTGWLGHHVRRSWDCLASHTDWGTPAGTDSPWLGVQRSGSSIP